MWPAGAKRGRAHKARSCRGSRVCLREELICIRSQAGTQRGFLFFGWGGYSKCSHVKNESVNKLGAE